MIRLGHLVSVHSKSFWNSALENKRLLFDCFIKCLPPLGIKKRIQRCKSGDISLNYWWVQLRPWSNKLAQLCWRRNISLKKETETSLQILPGLGMNIPRVTSTIVKNLCIDVLTVRAMLVLLRDWKLKNGYHAGHLPWLKGGNNDDDDSLQFRKNRYNNHITIWMRLWQQSERNVKKKRSRA